MGYNRFPKFADYFFKLMKEKEPGAKQVTVASKLGIKQGTLSKICGGMILPSDEMAARIAEIWGVDDLPNKVIEARREDAMKPLGNENNGEVDSAMKFIKAMVEDEQGKMLLKKAVEVENSEREGVFNEIEDFLRVINARACIL